MFDDENPWSDWVGRNGFSHPDAPCNGGPSRRLGPSLYRGGEIDPHSPAGRYLSPDEAAEGYASFELKRVLDKIRDARAEHDLFWAASAAFGSKNFSGRFGTAQRGSPDRQKFFALQKLLVQAELYDHLNGRISWGLGGHGGFDFRNPQLWEVAQHLPRAHTSLSYDDTPLKKAAERRDALLNELTVLFTRGDGAFAPIKAQLKSRAFEYWARYNEHAALSSEFSRSEAGGALGIAMREVVPVIALLLKSSDFAAKLSGVAPQLLIIAINQNNASDTVAGALTSDNAASSKASFQPSPPQAPSVVSNPPPRAVPAPTANERALAAQSNAAPDDGLNSSRVAAREKVVRDFYEGRPGLGQVRASQDMGCHPTTQEANKHPAGYGIDLSQPVKVVNIPPPDHVDQYVKAHGNPGNFFDPIGGQSADHLGLNGDPNLRQSRTFSVAKTDPSQQALVSKNGPIIDDWTDASNPVPTRGTGTQMTVDNTTKANIKPQPQPW